MGSLLLVLFIATVDHPFLIEEANEEFTYHFTDLGNKFPKYGDTMFCFTYPESSNDYTVSYCLLDNNQVVGCIQDSEDITPVLYMYPLEHTYEHCVIFPARLPTFNVQLNIYKSDQLIMKVRA